MNSIRRCVFVIAIFALACAPPARVDAPPLSGKTLDGKTASLADYKGKVVFVDFWATWCDACRAEIPELVKLQENLRAKGFVVFSVSMDAESASVAPFVKKMAINYTVILNGGERAPEGWVVPGLPTSYLIGRDGKVLLRQFGSKSIDKLIAAVEAAL